MDLFLRCIDDFGRSLGIDGLRPGDNGVVDLEIENVGRLQLEAKGELACLTLARPWPLHAAHAAAAALSLCHWDRDNPWPTHAGALGDEWLTMSVFLPMTELDVPALERALPYLSRLLDDVAEAG